MSINEVFDLSLASDNNENNNNGTTITAQSRSLFAVIDDKDNSVEALIHEDCAPLWNSTFLESNDNKNENKQTTTQEKNVEENNDTGYTSASEGEW